jgi:hypothetical protein
MRPLAAAVLLCAAPAVARPVVAQGGTWAFAAAPHADLWFHGLAVVGLEGYGPLPYYRPGYAAENRAAQRAAGRYPTPLDSLAPALRAAFQRDSAFEVLHFVPLYFDATEPGELLDALSEVARGGTPTASGARLVGSVLRSASQRRTLGRFVAALRAEWDGFLRVRWEADAARRGQTLATAASDWRDLQGSLAEFLRGRERGTVLASSALGGEGRVVADRVAVWLPSDSAAGRAVVAALLRELCFPLVTATVERTVRVPDRVSAERMSSRGAVRCGALLLERHRPTWLEDYRRVFLRAAGESRSDAAAFERVFAVPEDLLAALRAEIGAP